MRFRLKEDAPEQQGALTTFEDIATRQELQQEEPTGLHSTVRISIVHRILYTTSAMLQACGVLIEGPSQNCF